jgi:hypothetical protein
LFLVLIICLFLESIPHILKHPKPDITIRQSHHCLCIFTGLKGQLRLRNGDVVVDLIPPEIPKYREALEGVCTKLNALSTCFPGTPYNIKFAVAGTEVHTKPHNSAAPYVLSLVPCHGHRATLPGKGLPTAA